MAFYHKTRGKVHVLAILTRINEKAPKWGYPRHLSRWICRSFSPSVIGTSKSSPRSASISSILKSRGSIRLISNLGTRYSPTTSTTLVNNELIFCSFHDWHMIDLWAFTGRRRLKLKTEFQVSEPLPGLKAHWFI